MLDVLGRDVAVEQCGDAVISPALRQRYARFAKDRLLGIAFGVEISNVHRERTVPASSRARPAMARRLRHP